VAEVHGSGTGGNRPSGPGENRIGRTQDVVARRSSGSALNPAGARGRWNHRSWSRVVVLCTAGGVRRRRREPRHLSISQHL